MTIWEIFEIIKLVFMVIAIYPMYLGVKEMRRRYLELKGERIKIEKDECIL